MYLFIIGIHFLSNQQGTFIHVPKKPGGLKPELIDVDLVIGTYMYMYILVNCVE